VHTATPSIVVSLAAQTDAAEIEICADRACGKSLSRTIAAGKDGRARIAVAPLAAGRYFFRARGVRGGVVGTEASVAWPFAVPPKPAAVDTSSLAFFDPTEKELAARYKDAQSVIVLGDVDGDGYSDGVGKKCVDASSDCPFALLPGRPDATAIVLTAKGSMWIGLGDADGDGFGDAVLSGSNGATFMAGSAKGFSLGSAVSVVGGMGIRSTQGVDLDGDGFMDYVTAKGPGTSAILVHRGSAKGLEATPLELATGVSGYECLGDALSFGDVNGDGYIDLAVGAYCSAKTAGRAYVFLGGSKIDTKPAYVLAPPATTKKVPSRFGFSVVLRDNDGDGLDDLFVSTGCYQDEQEKGLCKEPLTYLFRSAKSGLSVDKPEVGAKIPAP